MKPGAVHELLEKLRDGQLSVGEAADRLRELPFEKIGDMARVDHHRELRLGAPEVVYGESKSAAQIASIMDALDRDGAGALATRVDADKAKRAIELLGRGTYHATARTLLLDPGRKRPAGIGAIGVICAGTSDLPVAEEAAVSLEFLGQDVRRIADIGVSGLHRLLDAVPALQDCHVLVVVAGMEGALPTVIAGLVDRPIIAVPTSVGYGVAAGGFAALGSMLSSCAPGVGVVNIDNGLGAAMVAMRINRKTDER